MRLLRIEDGKGQGVAIELHPHFTLIDGLRGSARARLVQALGAIPAGEVSDLRGELESQGVRLDLTPESLALLELPPEVQMVVRAADLPGSSGTDPRMARRRADAEQDRERLAGRLADAQAAAVAAEAERQRIEEALAAARLDAANGVDDATRFERANAALEAELEAARAAVGHAAVALTDAESALAALGSADASAEEGVAPIDPAVAAATAALEQARAALDPDAEEAADAAQRRLHSADVALTALDSDPLQAAVADAAAEPVDPAVRVLLDRRAELQASLDASSADDTAEVAEVAGALAVATRADGLTDEQIVVAGDLARDWDDLAERLTELGVTVDDADLGRPVDTTEADDDDVRAARARLHAAESELASLDEAASSSSLPMADVDALEQAHVAVLEAQERAEARFGGSKAKRRLAAARDAEQEVLDRLGFTTYAEFMMSSTRSSTAAEEGSLDVARNAVDQARAALDELLSRSAEADPGVNGGDVGDVDDPPEDQALVAQRDDLLRRRSAVAAEITTLLGHDLDGDPSAELRSLKPASAAAADLRQALSRVGMALDDTDFQIDTLVALARVWLAEHAEVQERRVALVADLAAVDAELAAVDAGAQHLLDAAEDAPRSRSEIEDEYLHATEAVDEAEARLVAHRAAHPAVTECEAALSAAEADAAEAARAVDDQRTQARHAVDSAREELGAAQAVEAAARQALEDSRPPDDAVPPVDPIPGLEGELAGATSAVSATAAEVSSLEAQLATADLHLAELIAADEAAAAERSAAGMTEDLLEEIEWYLLARVAEHRQISIAGSLPIILDDPFRGMPADAAQRLLEGIEKMASAVQVVLITDDRATRKWTKGLGEARAAIVHAR